jgi:serine/threonine-protein kinase
MTSNHDPLPPHLEGIKLDSTQHGVPEVVEKGYEETSAVLRPASIVDDRYRVIKKLRSGGMGRVYLAEDLQEGNFVSLKILDLKAHPSEKIQERFLFEIDILKSLHHPHIIRILGNGQAPGLFYYTMEYLPGGSLLELLEQQGPMEPVTALCTILEMTRAIHHAHQHKVLHRDLKPENVLFSADRRPILIDFGVAYHQDTHHNRMTKEGHLVGTPYYMPPERFKGSNIPGPQTDIYGLGILLYEMLVGHNPYTQYKATEAIMQIIQGELPPLRHYRPDATVELEQICNYATAKDPKRRFATAKAFENACFSVLRKVMMQSGVRGI